jgi:small subunit ribosomal protein S20
MSGAVANTPSQIKRNRQNEKRRQRNKAVRSQLKTHEKKAVVVATSGDDPGEAIVEAQSRLDSAAAKGIIHPNQAARRKSRLARRINAASSG